MVNAFTVFFNAAMQGVYGSANFSVDANRVVQPGSTVGKRSRRALYAVSLLGFLLQGLNETAGGDDDETGELNVNKISDYTLDKNISVMPGTKWSFKLPMSPEYAFAYAIGRRIYRAMSQRNYTKEAAGMVGAILDSLLPVRIADSTAPSVMKTLTPTALLPMAEVLMDENFMGQSFMPHQRPGQAEQPWHTIAKSSTSDMAKKVSELLNAATGGDNIQPGMAQQVLKGLSAAEGIEHVVGGYTGGLGKTVMQTANIAKAAAGDESKVDINQTPIAGRFIFTPSKGYTGRRYRELATGDSGYQYGLRRKRANEPISDPAIAATLSLYESTEKDLHEMFGELRAAEEHEDAGQVQRVRERIEVAQRRVIGAYTQAKRAAQ